MSLFKSKNSSNNSTSSQAALAEIALNSIQDGVVMIDKNGAVQFINPAAVTMTECDSANKAIGLDYGLVIKLESKEGRELPERENPLIQAIKTNQALEKAQVTLICSRSNKRIPISISVHPVDGNYGNDIITFRDITHELEEEGEQTEFISTASHEMRTPVATIDGYLSLALNPQTATIDERARGYLTSAQNASKHLGKLFQDLLDITKLDDGKIRPHFKPAEMIGVIKTISDDYIERAKQNKITFNFGSSQQVSFDSNRRLNQVVYGYIDEDFMREIMDNLIENALKYTPEGGSIYINVRGDGDRVLINVTDTGIGIAADDLGHIFQKFYRADNSDTREIGGTGLGLYLVKQRVEAMGGRVWAESAFGEGSTFYVSLPRLTSDEYEKRMIAVQNQMMQEDATQTTQNVAPTPVPPIAPKTSPAPSAVAASTSTAPAASSSVPTKPTASMPPAPTTPTPVSAPKPSIPAPQPTTSTVTSAPQPATPAVASASKPVAPITASAPQSATPAAAPVPKLNTPAPQSTATVAAPTSKPAPSPITTSVTSPPDTPPTPSTPNPLVNNNNNNNNNNLNGEAK